MSNKALFVMDMPECCVDCIFCFEIDEGTEACCTVTREQDNEDAYREIKEDYCQCKPDWCPMKPIPEKKEEIGMPRTPSMNDIKRIGFQKGWNACVDKILEGCNGEDD